MSKFAFSAVLASCFLVCLTLAGCSGGQSASAPVPNPAPIPMPTPASKIQHIVVIMQENRTFDNLFQGFPGADTVSSGMSGGTKITLQPIPLAEKTDLDHSHVGWFTDLNNGSMDGFSHAKAGYPTPNLPYSYVQQSDVVPYWTLAKAYTLGDRMFQSNTGPSFPAHQYMIAGQSQNADENPNGIWGCDAAATTRVALLGPNGTDLPGCIRASTTRRWRTTWMRRELRGGTTHRRWVRADLSGRRFRRFITSGLALTGRATSFLRRHRC